jgi:hypothetical protein
MDVTHEWVSKYINDPDVIVLYAHDNEYNIKATIVSSPVSTKPVVMSHGARIPLRCIEGLCVSTDARGSGLAGHMIAAADYLTSKSGPQAHIWCRELPMDPGVFTTAASIKTYAYLSGQSASTRAPSSHMSMARIPWNTFQSSWNPYRYMISTHTVIAESPMNRNQGMDVWHIEYKRRAYTVVVLHTRRRTLNMHQPIYEILWSSYPNEDVYTAVCAQYPDGIVFTTDADVSWKGWNYGRSGVHATYMYNYLPPIFRNCEFVILREEI